MSQKKLLEERIIELYNQGLSLQKVANFVGYKSANSVKNILIKYGIQRRGTAGFKEPFKENFFENIDSEEKAYFLGFLMADGNVYVRKQSQPCIRLEISVKDLEILERFKMAIESKNSICFDKRNCCSLKVHSCKMFNDLGKLGVIPNKTKHEIIPNINQDMMRHFIRGFFDWDGWCTNTTSHGKRKGSRKCIGFVSNYEFLDNLNIILNSEIGTRINKVVERIGCSMLLYSSKKDVESLREYMYNDATIYLKRKYDSCYKIYVNTERDWITIPCNA